MWSTKSTENYGTSSAEVLLDETDLKGELCAAEVGLLFLPEVVWFDDERHTDLSGEILLQRLQKRLDQLPLRTTHVDDDGESTLTDVLADGRHGGHHREGRERFRNAATAQRSAPFPAVTSDLH